MAKVALKSTGLTNVSKLYKEAGIDPDKQRLYLDKSGDIDIPLLPDDYIVLRGNETVVSAEADGDEIDDNPLVRNHVEIKFNGRKTPFEKAKITSDELCKLDKELNQVQLFADLQEAVDARIEKDVTLVLQDGDCYFTIPTEDEEDTIDLEVCSKADRKPPKGQKYRLKIDQEKHKVNQQEITGEEILKLAGKTYAEFTLNQKLRGGRRKPIPADEIVDLAEPGIERFETVLKQAQQGRL